MDAAYFVKEHVSLPDAMERYGFDSRKGKYLCPFHTEKTPSLSLYNGDSRYHCFGCGADGTVIDFVMQLYNISFQQAVAKLAYDFSVPIPNRTTHVERADFARIEAERRRKSEEKAAEKESMENEYWEAFDTWKRLCGIIREYRPAQFTEQLHPNYVKALYLLPYAEYQLEVLAGRRIASEQRDSNTLMDCRRVQGKYSPV